MDVFRDRILDSSPDGWYLRRGKNFDYFDFWPLENAGVATGIFSTKVGKISRKKPVEINLNLYKKYGLEQGRESFQLYSKRFGLNSNNIATTRLIYSTNEVRKVERTGEVMLFNEATAPHADAIITDNPRVVLFLYVADCAIIYLADPKKRAIGLVHSSWRTALKGVVENAIDAMAKNYGTNPKDLIAIVSPCLGSEHFEVGEEVAERFEMFEMGEMIVRTSNRKPRLDFYSINEELLKRSGVSGENIYAMRGFCTYEDEELFHSFRRGPIDDDGRHLNGLNGAFLSLGAFS